MARSSGTASGTLPAPPALRRHNALFLDFDGTLVDIAGAPDLVRVAPELPHLLGAVADLLDGSLALVSGRPLDELAGLLAPFSGAMAGQHGRERRRSDGSVLRSPVPPALARAAPVMADFAERHPGVMVEDKGGSLRTALPPGTLARSGVRRACSPRRRGQRRSTQSNRRQDGSRADEFGRRARVRRSPPFSPNLRSEAGCRCSSATTSATRKVSLWSIAWAEFRSVSGPAQPRRVTASPTSAMFWRGLLRASRHEQFGTSRPCRL